MREKEGRLFQRAQLEGQKSFTGIFCHRNSALWSELPEAGKVTARATPAGEARIPAPQLSLPEPAGLLEAAAPLASFPWPGPSEVTASEPSPGPKTPAAPGGPGGACAEPPELSGAHSPAAGRGGCAGRSRGRASLGFPGMKRPPQPRGGPLNSRSAPSGASS